VEWSILCDKLQLILGRENCIVEKTLEIEDAMSHLDVQMVPSEYIYPFRGVWWDLLGERQHDDVVIHAVTLVNHSKQVLSVESITVEGTDRGRLLQRVVFDRKEIQLRTGPIIARDQLGLRRLVDLILWTDQVAPPEKKLSASTELEPEHVLIFPNIYLMFHKRPDRLKVSVQFNAGGIREEAMATLKVVEYKSQIKYGFPLEGVWLLKGTPNTGVFDHHRFGVSNEFGVDFLRVSPRGKLFRGAGKRANDYYSYGERVLAAAQGKVVAVSSSETQEWFRFNPRKGETEEQFQERQLKEVRQALQGDVGRWAAGNYILIEHAEAEYSAYLHLKENSIRVQEGEIVQRGQPIAEVGNTGDSYGAHLHFQVMDCPDLVRGRSLPFEFENVEMSLSEPGWFVQSVS
jgi:murein DD-endopeptidase MepM/ murein hydrolase activator NlpD